MIGEPTRIAFPIREVAAQSVSVDHHLKYITSNTVSPNPHHPSFQSSPDLHRSKTTQSQFIYKSQTTFQDPPQWPSSSAHQTSPHSSAFWTTTRPTSPVLHQPKPPDVNRHLHLQLQPAAQSSSPPSTCASQTMPTT